MNLQFLEVAGDAPLSSKIKLVTDGGFSRVANERKLEDVAQKVFGISPRRYRQLAKEEKVPDVVKGKIDFVQASKALIEYYRQLAAGQGSLSTTDLRNENLQLKNDMLRMENMVKEGQIISRDSVLQEFLNRIAIVKAGLLSLPRTLPGRLTGKDGREMGLIIRRAVIGLLDKYSRRGGVLK